MAAFATVDDLAAFTRRAITDTADVNAATLLLDLASAAIRSYTHRKFDLVTGDVFVVDDPVGPTGLLLPELPVTAVTAVETLSGVTWTAVAAGAFAWDSYGRVWLTGNPWVEWPVLARSVRVTYNHGYASVPDDIRGVCLSVAARMFVNPAGYQAESLGNWSASYRKLPDEPFLDHEMVVLGNYRLVTVA